MSLRSSTSLPARRPACSWVMPPLLCALFAIDAPGAYAQETPASPDTSNHMDGFVMSSAQHTTVRDAPLNPGNFEQIPDRELELTSLLEGRFSGVTWRLRLDETNDNASGTQASGRVQELNRVFQLNEQTTLSIGKRIYSMDQAFVNQPLGFFQKQTDLSDPIDSLGQTEGLPMAILGWTGSRASAAALYSKDAVSHADGFNRGIEQSLLKFGYEFDQLSAAVIARRATGESNGWGATFSGSWGDAWSYYGSWYTAHGTERPILQPLLGTAAQTTTLSPGVLTPGSYRQNDGSAYPRATIGATFSPADRPKLQIEYSYDSRGLSDQQYASYLHYIDLASMSNDGLAPARLANASTLLIPQGLRRHYLDINLTQSWSRCDLLGGVYMGTADWSKTWYVNLEYRPAPHWKAIFSATRQAGTNDSERVLTPVGATAAARAQYLF